MKPVLDQLQPIELYLILQQNGMLRLDRRNLNAAAIAGIGKLFVVQPVPAVDLEHISAVAVESQSDDEGGEDAGGLGRKRWRARTIRRAAMGPTSPPRTARWCREEIRTGSTGKDADPDGFRWMKNRNSLKAVDTLADAHLINNTEILDFLIENAVAGLG